MLQAREVRNIDELMLVNMAAAMADGVYHDIAAAPKPGARKSLQQCAFKSTGQPRQSSTKRLRGVLPPPRRTELDSGRCR